MTSKELKGIENNIYNNPSDPEGFAKIAKSMRLSSIVYLSIAFVLFVFSLFVVKTVDLISIISPGFFYTLIILFIIYMTASILVATFYTKIKPFVSLLYYKIFDLVSFVVMLVICLSTLIMFFVTPTTVVGRSMNDTLASGDKVLVWHIGYESKRNDIVVVHVSQKYGLNDSLYIKRVVAVEGDKVTYTSGALYVNDNKVESMNSLTFQKCVSKHWEETGTDDSYVIPKGYSIVMGDHRSDSLDSREFGLVDNKDIVGKAVFSLLPFKKIPSKKLSYK